MGFTTLIRYLREHRITIKRSLDKLPKPRRTVPKLSMKLDAKRLINKGKDYDHILGYLANKYGDASPYEENILRNWMKRIEHDIKGEKHT